MIYLAEGAGRAEVVGHELVHTVFDGDTRITTFGTGFTGQLARAEGEAIEEHMGDVVGALLEQRFTARNEDRCLLGDDVDTMEAIGAASTLDRPCSLDPDPREWRSMCEPRMDNGGWCEGAARYTDLAYNRYDAYGLTSGDNDWVASHTNLGIGNRAVAALMRPAGSTTRLDDWRVRGLGVDTVERLWFRVALELPVGADWTRWGQAWSRGTMSLFDPRTVTPQEHAVRTSQVAAGLWNLPRTMRVVRPVLGGPLPSLPLPLRPVTSDTRPAVAQLSLPSGVRRTFVFFRPLARGPTSQRLQYVWADEPEGGPFPQVPTGFVGPCDLPLDVRTLESPAAASTDSAVFLLWSEPTGKGGVGTLRAASLDAGGAGASGCSDNWTPMAPGAERLLAGGPAAALWTQNDSEINCSLAAQLGVLPPFRAIGPMGLSIEDCVEIIERPQPSVGPFSPVVGAQLLQIMANIADRRAAQGIPVPYDPLRPTPDFEGVTERQLFELVPLLADDEQTRGALGALGKGLGARFDAAFSDLGAPSRLGADAFFEVAVDDPAGPTGTIEAIHLRFRPQILVVAFRDPAGALRVVPFADDAPTDGDAEHPPIPTLDASPNATDPALAVVTFSDRVGGLIVHRELLFAVYGTSEVVDGRPVPTRLSYRVARGLGAGDVFDEGIFAPARRIDTILDTRGVRRQVDYRLARTLRAPVVVGATETLHLFTVSLRIVDFAPDDGLGSNGPGDERTAGQDRVRHTELAVLSTGELTWLSERAVMLLDTGVSTIPPETEPQAGAALVTSNRSQLRFFYPRERYMSVRSRALR